MKLHLFKTLAILTILLGTSHGVSAQGSQKASAPAPPSRVEVPYRGGLVDPAQAKPKFTLTDTSGIPYDLSSKTQGYVTLLFFGYTNCPDMCPLQMHVIAQALKNVPRMLPINSRWYLSQPTPIETTPKCCGRGWITSTNGLSA